MTSFSDAALALVDGKKSGHMGAYLYDEHMGARRGLNLSGDALYQRIAVDPGFFPLRADRELLLEQVLPALSKYVQYGTDLLVLGTGGWNDVKKITLPMADVLGSRECVLVDGSVSQLNKIIERAGQQFPDTDFRPAIENFFEVQKPLIARPSLAHFGGLTVGNLIVPKLDRLPTPELVGLFQRLAAQCCGGFLLVSFNSMTEHKDVMATYTGELHDLFNLNPLYRMQAELQWSGFRADAFRYIPDFVPETGQMLHLGRAQEHLNFLVHQKPLAIDSGRSLHIHSSFMYRLHFWEHCAALAGLKPIEVWHHDTPVKYYLFDCSGAYTQTVTPTHLGRQATTTLAL